MNIFTEIYLASAKITVVHSIPGRLRLKIPGLEKIESFINALSSEEKKKYFCVKGVEEIEFSFETSKVLIHYNPKQTNDQQIIALLNQLREILISELKNLGKFSENSVKKNILAKLKSLGIVTI